jgi:hypothetical protein
MAQGSDIAMQHATPACWRAKSPGDDGRSQLIVIVLTSRGETSSVERENKQTFPLADPIVEVML